MNKKVHRYNLWNPIIRMVVIILIVLFVLSNYQKIGNKEVAGHAVEQTEVTF